MDICLCEIDQRWPTTCQVRVAMLEECVRRGLLKVKAVNQHGRTEAVWTNASWTEVRR